MSKGVCIFDLDNTLGEFRAIDFFGLLFEPKIIPNFYTMSDNTSYIKPHTGD